MDWTAIPFILGIASAILLSRTDVDRLSVPPPQGKGVVDASLFLRRAYHSSVVLNRKLYIDGGEFSYSQGNGVAYESSNTLISIDLTEDWMNGSVTLQSTPKPPEVPSLKDGGLWVDHRHGVLYTGFAGTTPSFGNPAPSPQGLWSFTPDQTGVGSWENLNQSADGSFTRNPRPFKGHATSGHGYGFFIGGFPAGAFEGDTRPFGGFMTYGFTDRKVYINSNIFNNDNGPTQRPGRSYGLNYNSHWGKRGILISMGGGNQDPSDNDGLATFDNVLVYDIDSQQWLQQHTSGDVPQPRRDFCIAGSPSTNRTYEILVYAGWGGRSGSDTIPFDSAYVLTLPGFFWVKADYPATSPRRGLTCNAVGGNQILTVGGVDATQQGDDEKTGFNTADPFAQGLAIFDLSSLTWKGSYTARRPVQPPAPQIQAYYNTYGRQPQTSFSTSDLAFLFSKDDFSSFGDDDPNLVSGDSYKTHGDPGAIAGGVVGGAAGVVILAGLAEFVRRRRKEKREEAMEEGVRRFEEREREGPGMLVEDEERKAGDGGNGGGEGGKLPPSYRGVVMSAGGLSGVSEGVTTPGTGVMPETMPGTMPGTMGGVGGEWAAGQSGMVPGAVELDGQGLVELEGEGRLSELDGPPVQRDPSPVELDGNPITMVRDVQELPGDSVGGH